MCLIPVLMPVLFPLLPADARTDIEINVKSIIKHITKMKKLKVIFASLVLCLGFVATVSSCSSDDDGTPAVPAAKSVEGVYNNNMTCSVMGSDSEFEDVTFTLTATDESTVNVQISSFGNPPMQVPEISVPGVKVVKADGAYTLAETEFSGTSSNGKAYSGTLQGTYNGTTMTIKFTLHYGAMPMPMICTFTAAKK